MSRSETTAPEGDGSKKKPGKVAVLLSRSLSTVILWSVAGAALFSGNPLALTALFLVLGGLGLWEYKQMWARRVALPWLPLVVAFAYLLAAGLVSWKSGTAHPIWLDLVFLATAAIASLAPSFWGTIEGERTLLRMGGGVLASLYIPFLFGFLLRLFYLPPDSGAAVALVLYTVVVTKFTDMGAYLTGSLIGKHKMAPGISPGKTWEGFAGALGFSLLSSLILVALMPEKLSPITLPHAAILGLGIGFLAVIGDLAESVFKRCLDTKDSGSFLPGIGGALDLIDSLLFTAPALYFYITLVLNRA